MRNAGLEEAQAGIKIAGRNINNLRYADDTLTLITKLAYLSKYGTVFTRFGIIFPNAVITMLHEF